MKTGLCKALVRVQTENRQDDLLDPITALLFHLSGYGLGRTRTSYMLPFGKPRYQTCDHQSTTKVIIFDAILQPCQGGMR